MITKVKNASTAEYMKSALVSQHFLLISAVNLFPKHLCKTQRWEKAR